jgi:fermentation-respiration switch protein FrsA (DUF1100 family)
VRSLLEELTSDRIETGLYIGVVNARGVTCRAHDTGGEPERALAEQHRAWASALAASAPRAAGVLRRIAENYSSDAKREDDQRDLNEFWH